MSKISTVFFLYLQILFFKILKYDFKILEQEEVLAARCKEIFDWTWTLDRESKSLHKNSQGLANEMSHKAF